MMEDEVIVHFCAIPLAVLREALQLVRSAGRALHTSQDPPLLIGDVPTGDAPTVWEVYRKHTILALSEDNTRIKQQRDWYAKHQSYLDRVTQRAEQERFSAARKIEYEKAVVFTPKEVNDWNQAQSGHAKYP